MKGPRSLAPIVQPPTSGSLPGEAGSKHGQAERGGCAPQSPAMPWLLSRCGYWLPAGARCLSYAHSRAVRQGSLGAMHLAQRSARGPSRGQMKTGNGPDDFPIGSHPGTVHRIEFLSTRARAMPASRKRAIVDAATTVYKLQGGTGKHVDGDVTEPLQGRPFQARRQPRDAGLCRAAVAPEPPPHQSSRPA
jgi:hypothetical protein